MLTDVLAGTTQRHLESIMDVVIIENSDDPINCEFMTDSHGHRLVFDDYELAEDWLMRNAERGVVYAKWGDDD